MDKDYITTECPQQFEVRQPRWLLIASIVFLVFAIGLVTYAAIEISAGVYDINDAAMYIFVPCAFVFFAIVGFYSYANDTFKYTDGEFVCKRVFQKTKTWNVENVLYVQIKRYASGAVNLVFWDKNDNEIATVTDGRIVWNDGHLRDVLYCHNIPVKGL